MERLLGALYGMRGSGESMTERLQKILSGAGICSRRRAEEYIEQGRVCVNGATARLGDVADPQRDTVTLDGAVVPLRAEPVYLMLNKPRGYVTTLSDEKGRPTVAELTADCGVRVYPVGRLDLNSEGLLLLTNDGAAAKILTHPSHEIEKRYLVWVNGDVEAALPVLRRPMTLDGTALQPAKVRLHEQRNDGARLLTMTIREGKNRQIRRMCEAAGLHVVRLRRIGEGPLRLGDLPSGTWRYLTEPERGWIRSLTETSREN